MITHRSVSTVVGIPGGFHSKAFPLKQAVLYPLSSPSISANILIASVLLIGTCTLGLVLLFLHVSCITNAFW